MNDNMNENMNISVNKNMKKNADESIEDLVEDFKRFETEEQRNKAYGDYIKKITPKNSLIKDVIAAFLVGGIICMLGQLITNISITMGASRDDAGTITSIVLIMISVFLTATHLFSKIAKVAGAGVLVPITGFANSVASCAEEYKVEGQVYGIGARIFSIAGPVILYGVLASTGLGFIYWLTVIF